MTMKERLIQRIETLPEEKAEQVLSYLDELEDDDPLAFLKIAEEIAENAPPEDLAKIPADASKNVDFYLYQGKKV
jgi:hypothetical protein